MLVRVLEQDRVDRHSTGPPNGPVVNRALVGARQRWKQGDLADSALVGARQRSCAMIQVLLQL